MSERATLNYAGIELPGMADDEIAISAVVLLKVIRPDGRLSYREFKSPDLHLMEALGMATTYTDTCRQLLMKGARPV